MRSLLFLLAWLLLLPCLSGCLVFDRARPGEPVRVVTWSEPRGRAPVGSVVLVHGLNNSQGSMAAYVQALRWMGFAVASVGLTGHDPVGGSRHGASRELWLDAVGVTFRDARERYPDGPIVGFGYSLGAAILVSWVDEGHDCDGLVLVAPAIRPRRGVDVLRPLRIFAGWNIALPSLTPAAFRAFRMTSLDSYNAMFDVVDGLDKLDRPEHVGAIPVLVIADPDDELIDVDETIAWMRRHRLRRWWFRSLRAKPWHHIVLDSESVGVSAWNDMMNQIHLFLPRRAG